MTACNQVGAIKTKLPFQQLRRTTLISLSSLQQVTEGVLSDYALGTQPTNSRVLAEGVTTSLPPLLVHLWWSGHPFCCGTGSSRGPYSIRHGTFKTGQEGVGFLLSPGLCSGSSAFGSSAKAMTNMLCCEEVGFLGAGIAIPSYNTVQQVGSVTRKSIPLHRAELFPMQSSSSLGVLGGKWGCLSLT